MRQPATSDGELSHTSTIQTKALGMYGTLVGAYTGLALFLVLLSVQEVG